MKLAAQILKEGIAKIILVGSEEAVKKGSEGLDLTGAVVVDPATSDRTQAYIDKLVELRQQKRHDTGTGKRDPVKPVSVLWRYDGKNGRCRRYGIRSMPFYR